MHKPKQPESKPHYLAHVPDEMLKSYSQTPPSAHMTHANLMNRMVNKNGDGDDT